MRRVRRQAPDCFDRLKAIHKERSRCPISLIHDEKLSAAALDRGATATLVGSFFGPIATIFTSSSAINRLDLPKMLVFSGFPIMISVALHVDARRVLQGLKS